MPAVQSGHTPWQHGQQLTGPGRQCVEQFKNTAAPTCHKQNYKNVREPRPFIRTHIFCKLQFLQILLSRKKVKFTVPAKIPTIQYTVISRKQAHPQKYAHPPFLTEVVAKGAFLSKVRPPICAVLHGIILSKKHRRSSTVQEEGLTRQPLLLLHKRATKEALQNHCMCK